MSSMQMLRNKERKSTRKGIYSIWFALVTHSDKNVQNQNGGVSNFPEVGKNIWGQWLYLGSVRSQETFFWVF
jgi:hypothetical protein